MSWIIKHLVYTHMDTSYVWYDISSRLFKRSHWMIFSLNVLKYKLLRCFHIHLIEILHVELNSTWEKKNENIKTWTSYFKYKLFFWLPINANTCVCICCYPKRAYKTCEMKNIFIHFMLDIKIDSYIQNQRLLGGLKLKIHLSMVACMWQ
jgi:hypothetical protein